MRALVAILFLPGIKEVRAISKYVPAFRGMVPFRWVVEWRVRIKGRNGKRKLQNRGRSL